jgi:protein-tyrosine kinase
MGKILSALEAANGDLAEIVRQSLEQPGNGKLFETIEQSARASGNQPGTPGRDALWTRIAENDSPSPDTLPRAEPASGEVRTHSLPWDVSDSSPLLSAPGNEHAAEQYRAVRTRILLLPKSPATIVVTSPGTGDGKTLTSINLAATFARKSDHEVLLVDTDMRRPAVHSRLGMQATPGLGEVLTGQTSIEDAVVRIEQLSNLFVLPSGGAAGNAGELLDSPAWHTTFSALRARFRTVIYDCPPVEVFSDYDLIAADCDGAILVLTPDCTDRFLAFRALEKVGDKLLGVVINRAQDWFLWKHHASNYYYYRQGTSQKKTSK